MLGEKLAAVNTFVVLGGNSLLLWSVASPGASSESRYLAALLLLLLIATWLFLNAGFQVPESDTAD